MKLLDLAKERRSVRTFDGSPVKAEDMEKLKESIASADNPYNLPIDWKFLSAEENGLRSAVIAGTDCWLAGKMDKAEHAEEAFGFSFEKIVLDAQELGIGTTWIAGTMNREVFEQVMDVKDDQVMPCVSPIGYPASKLTIKETMMRKAVKADSRLPFKGLFFKDNFKTPLTPEAAGEMADVLEAVRWAPSAVNKQPWRLVVTDEAVHFYEFKTKGFAAGESWDVQKIDIGIALYHFFRGMEELGRKVELFIEDPEIPHVSNMAYIASCRVI